MSTQRDMMAKSASHVSLLKICMGKRSKAQSGSGCRTSGP
eukprot:CAMPEP_0178451482 /NCGR_PEP_ID=MMETSP0689_2-20121128/43712_1 /TAXON_ID=160604 /ORGANISM="Amphidinium massartii, Strain CS-259" /LENGTH=39 /DNA_ID= /DNA_START= /DNA_END= /DNA_ORIENTATION=